MYNLPSLISNHVGSHHFGIQGDGINHGHANSSFRIESQQLLLPDHSLEKEYVKLKDAIETECICHKSFISLKSINGEIRLVDRLWSSETLQENFESDDHVSNDVNDEEHTLNLSSLLLTLQKCSTRNFSTHQVFGITRLAKCYRGSDTITKDQAKILQILLETDGSPVQQACLIVLSKLAAAADTLELMLKNFSTIIDCIFNLASDPKSSEVQLAALEVIEQISKHQKLTLLWDKQLEDIVYPLVLGLIKSSNSTENLKLTCLNILKNISQLQDFSVRVKLDVLTLLNQARIDLPLKGMFLEILHEILETFNQRISDDVLETNILPVLNLVISQQKCTTQSKVLKLLTYLARDIVSRNVLLRHSETMAVCIYLNKKSLCRKVLAGTCCLMQEMLNMKNVSQARQFMTSIADSSLIDVGHETLGSDRNREDQLMSRVNKKLRCSDCQLWIYLDEFIGHLATYLEKYGCLEKLDSFSSFKCELSKFGNINNDQLTVIASLIGCFNNFCFWPLHRPKCHEDFMLVSDDNILNEELRQQLKCLKHHQVFFIWKKVGIQIMTLCRHFASRLNLSNKKTKDNLTEDKTHSTEIKNNGDVQQYTLEITLAISLLNFLLYIAATSCYSLSSEQQVKYTSEKQIENGIKKNLQKKLAEREIITEKRLLRRQIIEEGLFSVMGQLIQLDNINIKIISTTIIRLCLQPTGEKNISAATKPRHRAMSADVHKPLLRLSDHQANDSAGQILGAIEKQKIEQRPQSSLPNMMHSKGNSLSDEVLKREATFKSALDSRKYSLFTPLTPRTQKKPIHLKADFMIRESRVGILEINRHFASDIGTQSTVQQTLKKGINLITDYGTDHLAYLMSPLEAGYDIIPECCERIIRSSAADVLKGIFSVNPELKKISLFLLHDLVKNGQRNLHMELSKLGCVPKLISFLRINDNDLLLEITGLAITRLLLASDRRICQLFNFHGGSHLLMALLQNKPPEDLKEAIVSTLNTVNYMVHTDLLNDSSNRPVDIWGHIMQRWKEEDKVVDVLTQYL